MAGRGHGATGRGKGAAGRGKGGSSRDQCDIDRGGGSDRGQCSADTRGGSGRGQGGIGGGLTRKIVNARGTTFESGRNAFSSQVPPLPTNKRHTMLPHLLLLLDTKGLQLVLVFTLIQQLEPKCTILVHQVRGFFMEV